MYLQDDVLHAFVEGVPALLEACHDEKINFLWHGGEPMLVGRERLGRWMDDICQSLSNYDVTFSMQSNGYLIDTEWINFFKNYHVDVGISLDGYPELHDANRPTSDGKPTADRILHNIQRMREAGLSVGTLMVLNTAVPVDDETLFDFIEQYELQPKIHPVIPCGRAEHREDAEAIYDNYTALLKKLYRRCLTSKKNIVIEPLNEIMDAIIGTSAMKECSFGGTCGQQFICLYTDGEVGFCGRNSKARQLTYGRIQQQDLLSLYQSANAECIRRRQDYLQQHQCRDCKEWALCHGGCAFEAMNYWGTLQAVYPHCQQRKELLQWLRTTGLAMLKEALIRQKREARRRIKEQRNLLKEVAAYERE